MEKTVDGGSNGAGCVSLNCILSVWNAEYSHTIDAEIRYQCDFHMDTGMLKRVVGLPRHRKTGCQSEY